MRRKASTSAPVGAGALRVSGVGIVLALLGVLVAMPLVSLARGALEQG